MKLLQVLFLLVTTTVEASEQFVSVSFDSIQKQYNAYDTSPRRVANGSASTFDDLTDMESFVFLEGRQGKEENVTFVKTSSKARLRDEGEEVVWHGSADDRIGFATLLQTPSGLRAGIWSTETALYELMEPTDGTLRVVAIDWSDTMREDLFVRNNAGSIPAPEAEQRGNLRLSNSTTIGSNNEMDIVDVLVVVTHRAMCDRAFETTPCDLATNRFFMDSALVIVEAQINEAFRFVEINAEVNFLETIYIAPGFDLRAGRGTLDFMEASPDIKKWREDFGADLVAMITGPDPFERIGGIANLPGAFSVTDGNGIYSILQHEIGR